jgi:hypothetical protein
MNDARPTPVRRYEGTDKLDGLHIFGYYVGSAVGASK